MERNMQLYRLIQTKPGSYEILLEAMKQTNQNGVEELLRAVYLQWILPVGSKSESSFLKSILLLALNFISFW